MNTSNASLERFKRHPSIPELWYEPETGAIWTSKIGTNTPVVMDWPVRIKNQRSGVGGYLVCAIRRRGASYPMKIHRIVAECLLGAPIPPGMVIDHIDGNRVNNAPSNLRIVRPRDNCRNLTRTPSHNRSSGLIGVSFYARTGRWRAYIVVNNRSRHIGYFATREEARGAYLAEKEKHHGIPSSNLDPRALVVPQ